MTNPVAPAHFPITCFSGNLDDIRINNSLLPVSEIEGVWQEALAVPEPTTWVMLLGGLGLLLSFQRARRWARMEA